MKKRISQAVQARNVLFVCLFLLTMTGISPFPLPAAHARNAAGNTSTLSDGQFVYGPNVGDFDLGEYLAAHAPYMENYADELYGRAKYFSINPKVYITLLEVHSQMISRPAAARLENPFDLEGNSFISQIDTLSNIMLDAYYRHLYTYSSMEVSQRNLPPLTTRSGNSLGVSSDMNAGTYAILAAIARMEQEQDVAAILDNSQPGGFYQTYLKLFPGDAPASEENHIYTPQELTASSTSADFLQPPYLRGQSWLFNGVHNYVAGSSGNPLTDASSIDFSPGWPSWNKDTSNMWVVAAASGIPTKISNCFVEVKHPDGWETAYYHLENVPNFSGWINQNDKIGIIANTLAEATCNGGSSTGPHVHFGLKRNGAFVAINGSLFSGWAVHSGRWNYDTNRNYMWLERTGSKKYVGDPLLSEAASEASVYSTISGSTTIPGTILGYTDGVPRQVTSQWGGSYSLLVTKNWSGTVTPTHPCYTFSPPSRSYSNVTASLTGQDFTAVNNNSPECKVTVGVFRPGNGVIFLKNANISGYADLSLNYGMGGDYPIVGDWDNNGTDTIGVYRNGTFLLRNSNTVGFADLSFAFGQPGDQPVAGDWDGNGTVTIGVYRPSTGQFLLRNSNMTGAPDVSFFLGNAGDIGIAGDWDGDGVDTTGVFRPGNGVIYLKNKNESGFAEVALNYGMGGDKPVVGDWDGNGTTTIGILRGNRFYLRNSNTNGFANITLDLGLPGDMPIAGNWDGKP